MREIKFRAWNKETKKMTSWEKIHRLRNFHKLITLDYVIIMQYTGLKDCDGNEIFEGDWLIDIDCDFKEKQRVFWQEKEGAWCLDESFNQDKKFYHSLAENLDKFRFKITGNIYEK